MKITKSALKELVRKVYEEEKTAYQKFFDGALKKFGVSSPADFKDEEKFNAHPSQILPIIKSLSMSNQSISLFFPGRILLPISPLASWTIE